jgi:hypothetical protein
MVSFWFSLPPLALSVTYSPNVSNFRPYPGSPVPNVPVTINGTVFDKFRKIKISMLSFSTDNGITWHIKNGSNL